MAAPAKTAAASRSAAAVKADRLFWATFHGGNYEAIQPALDALTAAYLQSPRDPKTAAHIAWLHNWRIAERARLAAPPATITDDTALGRRYFEEASTLDPSDARLKGFLAGHLMIEGTLHQDERLKRRGYFAMRRAIDAWPEFNLFTGGFVMSRLPRNSPQFQEGLDWEWRNLDECIGERLDRRNPDYSRYMKLETKKGRKRVCWNSWIAPHNLEGFFLNMGDMLAKSGDWRTARRIYANARLHPDYARWPYRPVLEDRIANAQKNVTFFNSPAAPLMINSRFACMACHQQ